MRHGRRAQPLAVGPFGRSRSLSGSLIFSNFMEGCVEGFTFLAHRAAGVPQRQRRSAAARPSESRARRAAGRYRRPRTRSRGSPAGKCGVTYLWRNCRFIGSLCAHYGDPPYNAAPIRFLRWYEIALHRFWGTRWLGTSDSEGRGRMSIAIERLVPHARGLGGGGFAAGAPARRPASRKTA
jgi:hypothetical protein